MFSDSTVLSVPVLILGCISSGCFERSFAVARSISDLGPTRGMGAGCRVRQLSGEMWNLRQRRFLGRPEPQALSGLQRRMCVLRNEAESGVCQSVTRRPATEAPGVMGDGEARSTEEAGYRFCALYDKIYRDRSRRSELR